MTRFTSDTWLPAINVICWLFLVITILGVLTRIGTKLWVYRKLTKDDYVIIFSAVFEIAQGIATSTATANGYGEHIKTLSDDKITAFMKSQYAADILAIVSLVSSKISHVMFIRSITIYAVDRKVTRVLIIVLSIWGLVSVIAVAFQCQPQPTWDYLAGTCYDRLLWQNFFSIFNIITELAIISQNVSIIARIQTKLERKLKIALVFGLRVFVVAAVIAHIVVINNTFHDPDVTYATWSVSVTNQLILCSSIITACSAQLKPFLDSLRSSGMRLDALTRSYQYNSPRFYGHSFDHNRYPNYSFKSAFKPRSVNLRILTGGNAHPENELITSEAYVSASMDWNENLRQVRTFAVTEERRRSCDEFL